MKKYLVTVQRPTWESTQIVVEADDEIYAEEKAIALAQSVPSGRWETDDPGAYSAKDYDIACVEVLK